MSEESLTETNGFSKGPLEVYNMKNGRRGRALIFNYEQFDPDLQMNPRFGSETDCKNLEKSLKHLGFEVKVFRNLNKHEVNSELDKDYDEDYEDDNVYAYDGKLPIKTITDKFKGTECKSLVKKPKIFIWQVCSENEEEEAHDAIKKKNNLAGAGAVKTLPAAADFIMCYAVAKGSFSHRHTKKGCWYIQDLCKMLERYGDSLEFTELLTLVNREVATRDSGDNSIKGKQIPCFASMLTKELYFHPKQ
ncbi:caspase-6-like [Betta splendens]|uniref:Caspase-6 n=1 Tax=Betta splendens TaxID=158456 RepID=A0A9W2XPV1_BETSP|nr:caspase-6-like [Betta splendens]